MAADGFRDAWPAEPRSTFANEPITNQLGPSGKASTFTNAQGLRLASYFWPAAKSKAVVMLLHGNGAYVCEFLRTAVSPRCLSSPLPLACYMLSMGNLHGAYSVRRDSGAVRFLGA